MPRRSSKNKSGVKTQNSAPTTMPPNFPLLHSSSVSRKSFSTFDLRILFDTYANKSSRAIDPEGIERLCSDLGVDHTDVRILMLAWKLKAAKQGYFTQEEWMRGLMVFKIDNIEKLKNYLTTLERQVKKPDCFEDFYRFAFRYCLDESHKCLDIETVCVLMPLVFGSKFQSQVESFTEFLKCQSEYKSMNIDQWILFLRFCKEVSFPDLQNHGIDQAWPVILDNFVEWIRERRD